MFIWVSGRDWCRMNDKTDPDRANWHSCNWIQKRLPPWTASTLSQTFHKFRRVHSVSTANPQSSGDHCGWAAEAGIVVRMDWCAVSRPINQLSTRRIMQLGARIPSPTILRMSFKLTANHRIGLYCHTIFHSYCYYSFEQILHMMSRKKVKIGMKYVITLGVKYTVSLMSRRILACGNIRYVITGLKYISSGEANRGANLPGFPAP